jgi:hypothetical protein
MTARKVLEKTCESKGKGKDKDIDECYFCVNSEIVESIVSSAGWRKQMKKYLRLASKTCRHIYRESEEADRRSGYSNTMYASQIQDYGELICQRCGVFECNGDDKCPWFFGETNVNKTMAAITKVEWTRQTKAAMKHCKCKNKSEQVEKSNGVCTCGSCKNAYGNSVPGCKKCSRCCIDIQCKSHFRRPAPPRYKPAFCRIIEHDSDF